MVFVALIFGGDVVDFLNLWEKWDPTAYLILLWAVVIWSFIIYKVRDFLKSFDFTSATSSWSQINDSVHNQQFESTLHSEQNRTTAQTVTWEYVNPFSINGK